MKNIQTYSLLGYFILNINCLGILYLDYLLPCLILSYMFYFCKPILFVFLGNCYKANVIIYFLSFLFFYCQPVVIISLHL